MLISFPSNVLSLPKSKEVQKSYSNSYSVLQRGVNLLRFPASKTISQYLEKSLCNTDFRWKLILLSYLIRKTKHPN